MKFSQFALIGVTSSLLFSCSDGLKSIDRSPQFKNPIESHFIDSGVENLGYIRLMETGHITGIFEKSYTGAGGKFVCEAGEVISFSLGNHEMGKGYCNRYIFLRDLINNDEIYSKYAAIIQNLSMSDIKKEIRLPKVEDFFKGHDMAVVLQKNESQFDEWNKGHIEELKAIGVPIKTDWSFISASKAKEHADNELLKRVGNKLTPIDTFFANHLDGQNNKILNVVAERVSGDSDNCSEFLTLPIEISKDGEFYSMEVQDFIESEGSAVTTCSEESTNCNLTQLEASDFENPNETPENPKTSLKKTITDDSFYFGMDAEINFKVEEDLFKLSEKYPSGNVYEGVIAFRNEAYSKGPNRHVAKMYDGGAPCDGGSSGPSYGETTFGGFSDDMPCGGSSGEFPTTGSTGEFPTTGSTGEFPTTGSTGEFPTTGSTGEFPTTGSTGSTGDGDQGEDEPEFFDINVSKIPSDILKSFKMNYTMFVDLKAVSSEKITGTITADMLNLELDSYTNRDNFKLKRTEVSCKWNLSLPQ